MRKRIELHVKVAGTPTRGEDADAAGTYLVEVDADLSAGDQASAALDAFHQAIPVGELEDFTFTVSTLDGKPLHQGDAEGYSLSSRAKCLGRI